VAGTCGYGEELSSSINAGNFLASCKVLCWVLKKYSAPWSKYGTNRQVHRLHIQIEGIRTHTNTDK
jgi:hypothetical protein